MDYCFHMMLRPLGTRAFRKIAERKAGVQGLCKSSLRMCGPDDSHEGTSVKCADPSKHSKVLIDLISSRPKNMVSKAYLAKSTEFLTPSWVYKAVLTCYSLGKPAAGGAKAFR